MRSVVPWVGRVVPAMMLRPAVVAAVVMVAIALIVVLCGAVAVMVAPVAPLRPALVVPPETSAAGAVAVTEMPAHGTAPMVLATARAARVAPPHVPSGVRTAADA